MQRRICAGMIFALLLSVVVAAQAGKAGQQNHTPTATERKQMLVDRVQNS